MDKWLKRLLSATPNGSCMNANVIKPTLTFTVQLYENVIFGFISLIGVHNIQFKINLNEHIWDTSLVV